MNNKQLDPSRFAAVIFAAFALTVFISPFAAFAQEAPRITHGGFYATDRVRRGGSVQAAVALDVPQGFHVNANKPLGKYSVPTVVSVTASEGVRVSPVTYPRGSVRAFKFTDEKLAVYEGRPVMRFTLTVPANFQGTRAVVRARVKFQSCNDEVCFPPTTRDMELPIDVVGAGEPVRPTNTAFFRTL
ncbi:MAG: protein-disulfide reductase DsbD N-terminal domain-containing protein [Pyrinomonadaceae bacterium MAG19_C2-C3]|nr:protein-disulfide reductase DsbD N-terminal domain-containing protein [Pyrinomonadaceae bacterium MAG19_C2-C3]